MRLTRVSLALICCVFALAVVAEAQGRRPGLYETVSEMTWQQSPLPPGMTLPPGMSSPFGGGKHTSMTCLTAGDLEHYGTVPPENQRNCRMTSVTKHAKGMTAEMECTGEMTGKATVEAAWLDDGRSKGKVHFLGSMQAGADSLPVEWTTEYISSYKGPDCGSVKPAATHSH